MNRVVMRGATSNKAAGHSSLAVLTRENGVRTFWLVAVCLLILCVWKSVPWLMSENEARLVSKIDLQGAFQYQSEAELKALMQPYLGAQFMHSPLTQIKADIESLPWIKKATVSRVWPSQLLVDFEEQTPIAVWNDLQVLSDEGLVLDTSPFNLNGDMPRLDTDFRMTAEERLSIYQQFLLIREAMKAYGLESQKLTARARGTFELMVSDGVKVMLGHSPYEYELKRLGALYQSDLEKVFDEIERIDLRYPNGLAVKWKPETLAMTQSHTTTHLMRER